MHEQTIAESTIVDSKTNISSKQLARRRDEIIGNLGTLIELKL